MFQPCSITTLSLDLNNLERACDHPTVKAMLEDGWRVRTSLAINRSGKDEWLLLMEKGESTSHTVSLDHNVQRKLVACAVAFGIALLVQSVCLILVATHYLPT